MEWRKLRERAVYLVMSAFLAWHTVAIVVAPAPDGGVIASSLRTVQQPYLTFFRLNNIWSFFAPNVGPLSELRYFIEDEAGNRHDFRPVADLNWHHPMLFWGRSWHYAIMDEPERFAEVAGLLFCRKHAALHPASVTLVEYKQEPFTPDDHLAGKDPMDPEFVTVDPIKLITCHGS
jgi:hypothetical protein